ncbi:MAG: hypothetical protein ACD_39C01300G0006, partial [uncultured bacterium]
RDPEGRTSLMHVVSQGNDLEIVQYLVELGAEVNAKDNAGRTVFDCLVLPPEPPESHENEHEAWAHAEEHYIRNYLEKMGAQRTSTAVLPPAEVRHDTGQEILPDSKVVKKQRRGPAYPTASAWDWALFAAINQGAIADVESLLATDKVNINARDAGGWTPLMRASSKNLIDIMNLLLKGGADPDLKDNDGVSAMSVAGPDARLVLAKSASGI